MTAGNRALIQAAMEPGLSDQDDENLATKLGVALIPPQWSLVFPTRMTTRREPRHDCTSRAAMEPGLSDQDDVIVMMWPFGL